MKALVQVVLFGLIWCIITIPSYGQFTSTDVDSIFIHSTTQPQLKWILNEQSSYKDTLTLKHIRPEDTTNLVNRIAIDSSDKNTYEIIVYNFSNRDFSTTIPFDSTFGFDAQSFEFKLKLRKGNETIDSTSIYVEQSSGLSVGVKQDPYNFKLTQNYPNPFNPTTKIQFHLPQPSEVQLDIYNVTGQKVETLVDKMINAGSHTFTFDANKLPSGVYIYRLKAEEYSQSKKMILVK